MHDTCKEYFINYLYLLVRLLHVFTLLLKLKVLHVTKNLSFIVMLVEVLELFLVMLVALGSET